MIEQELAALRREHERLGRRLDLLVELAAERRITEAWIRQQGGRDVGEVFDEIFGVSHA